MGFRQNRNREEKKRRKELRREGLAMISSSGENRHYEDRSIERSQNGGLVPFCAKKLPKSIRRGQAKIVGKNSGSKTIRLPTGEVIITDNKMEKVITYLGHK